MASRRAYVQIPLPTFQVRFICNQRNGVSEPTEKFYIVASADDFLGLIVNIVNQEH
jgi:hypothetical protein